MDEVLVLPLLSLEDFADETRLFEYPVLSRYTNAILLFLAILTIRH